MMPMPRRQRTRRPVTKLSATDAAGEIPYLIEGIVSGGWAIRIGISDGCTYVGAIKEGHDVEVDVKGAETVKNLHTALARLVERIKL